MGTSETRSAGERRYSPPYRAEQYIRLHVPKSDARRFAIIPSFETLAICAGYEEQETEFAGWFKKGMH